MSFKSRQLVVITDNDDETIVQPLTRWTREELICCLTEIILDLEDDTKLHAVYPGDVFTLEAVSSDHPEIEN